MGCAQSLSLGSHPGRHTEETHTSIQYRNGLSSLHHYRRMNVYCLWVTQSQAHLSQHQTGENRCHENCTNTCSWTPYSIAATEVAGLTVLLVLLKGNIGRIFVVSECLCSIVKKTPGFVKVWTSLSKINRYCTARDLKKVLISKLAW